ncbi:hypothetical protein ACWDTP_25555 [Mycobacterium sp. NPDC003449]
MVLTLSVAAAVHARAGDVVSVFFVGESSHRDGAARFLFKRGPGNAAQSPLLFNETAGAWFMTEYHAVGPASRMPGQAKLYTRTPDPSLPVNRVVRGQIVETFMVQDMTYNHLDTVVTLEVVEDRAIPPGETWLPGVTPRTWPAPHR